MPDKTTTNYQWSGPGTPSVALPSSGPYAGERSVIGSRTGPRPCSKLCVGDESEDLPQNQRGTPDEYPGHWVHGHPTVPRESTGCVSSRPIQTPVRAEVQYPTPLLNGIWIRDQVRVSVSRVRCPRVGSAKASRVSGRDGKGDWTGTGGPPQRRWWRVQGRSQASREGKL